MLKLLGGKRHSGCFIVSVFICQVCFSWFHPVCHTLLLGQLRKQVRAALSLSSNWFTP